MSPFFLRYRRSLRTVLWRLSLFWFYRCVVLFVDVDVGKNCVRSGATVFFHGEAVALETLYVRCREDLLERRFPPR